LDVCDMMRGLVGSRLKQPKRQRRRCVVREKIRKEGQNSNKKPLQAAGGGGQRTVFLALLGDWPKKKKWTTQRFPWTAR